MFTEVKGLRIANPQGFADPVMADIPELYIDYDLGAFLRGMVHLTEVRLDIEKFVVVRNPGNALNVSALKGLIPPPQGSGPPPKIAIDLVVLHIGKAEYRQYGAQMIARDFTLNLDERIKNVTDPKALLNAVISRVLSSAGIAALAGEGLAGLKEQGQQMVQGVSTAVVDQTKTAKQGAEQIVGAVAETVKETADNVKKLLVPSQ